MRSETIDGNSTAKTPRAPRKPKGNLFLHFLASLASWRLYLFVLGALLVASTIASADSPAAPFYYATATPMERQIVSIPVGVNENVGQAVVSRDRKYVTLNVDPSLLDSASIRNFTYQKGGLGFVGSGAPLAPARPAAGNGLTPSIAASPGEIAPPVSILDKPGMILIAPLER